MQPSAKQLSQKTSTSSQDPYSLLRMLLSNSGENETAVKNVMAEDNTLERRLAFNRANMPTGAKTQYSPIQAAGLSALMQIIPQQVNEAVSAGVPYSSVLKDLGLDAQGNPTQQSTVPAYQQQSMIPNAQRQQVMQQGQPQAVSGQQPIAQGQPQQDGSQLGKSAQQDDSNYFGQQATELVNPKGRSLFGNVLNTVGNLTGINAMNTAVDSVRLANIAKAQEIAGQVPIQPTDRLVKEIDAAYKNATLATAEYNNIVSQENKISEQYVKDFAPLRDATDAMGKINALYQDSLENPNNNVNDFFLVYNAIKAADPTAVKEGEYKTVKDLLPLASKVLNLPNGFIKGEFLTPDQRERIVRTAATQYNGLAKRFEPLAKQYEDKIKSYGGSPKRVLTNYGVQKEESINKPMKIGRFQVEVN